VAVASAFGCKVSIIMFKDLNYIKIHVDNYRYELYGSIKDVQAWAWGPFLAGRHKYQRANFHGHYYGGALTQDPNTHFHSCESRGRCPIRDAANVVQIIPVTSRREIRPARHETGQISQQRPISHELSGKESVVLKKRIGLDFAQGQRLTQLRETILKEPGHTLLVPRTFWWTKESTTERPPIFSSDGETLPYYIVTISDPVLID